MASKKLGKETVEFAMFQDYWKLVQKFWIPENNDSYWELLMKEVKEFYKKYNFDYAEKLALCLIEELERKGAKNGIQ